ncbi:MAG: hypothetical protein AAF942_02265 [Pseudomonadota bacterium]
MATDTAQSDSLANGIAAVESLRRGARLSEAMVACQDMLRHAPREPRLLLLAATICRDTRQHSEGLAFLDQVLDIPSPTVTTLCDTARLRRQCGDSEGATDAYRQALSADSACSAAHFELAELLADNGKSDDAVYHLEVAIAVEPGRLDARERLASLLEARGDGAEAIALRRETMHRARRRVGDLYTKIRTPAAADTPRALQRLRLSWAHALLVFGTAGMGIAKYDERDGRLEDAVVTYDETLAVLAEGADQARSAPALQRAFATASLAFAQCHYELALLHERAGAAGWAIYHLEEALRAHGSPWIDAYARLGGMVSGRRQTVSAIRDRVAEATHRREKPSPYPVSRWAILDAAQRWFADVQRARDMNGDHRENLIAMIAASPAEFEQVLAIACVLLARGHRVDLLWWPGLRFDGSGDAFDEWDETLMAREIEQLASGSLPDGLRLLDLRGFSTRRKLDGMEEAAEILAAADMGRRSATGRISTSDKPVPVQQHDRAGRNLNAMGRIAAYLKKHGPRHLLIRDGDSMEAGCGFRVARLTGLDTVVWHHETDGTQQILVSRNRSRSERDYSTLWQADAPHELSTERKDRVLSRLATRTGGDYRLVSPRKRFVPPQRSFKALADHRLDSVRPVAVLFGDRAGGDPGGDTDAFPDSRTWILRNIDFFAQHPEWQLIVRLYPQDGPSGIRAALRERHTDLPRNVSLVEVSDAKLDYQLLDVAQVGLFRANPIGLEISLMGVIAIAAGRPYFCGQGFTRDAEDEDDYFRVIRRAMENPDAVAMTDREIEIAWCFADMCMHDAPKPFPWSRDRFWRDISEDWPLSRVLGSEGVARFGPVFAAMGGEIDFADGVCGRID